MKGLENSQNPTNLTIELRNRSNTSAIALWAIVGALALLSVPADGQIRFENRQPQSGMDFVLENGTTPDKPVVDSVLGGVALLDYDNDGYLDIFLTNGARIPSLTKENSGFWNKLYHNNHDGTFTDVTSRAGLMGAGYSVGAAAADFDNDGWSDIYVTGVNQNILYHNNKDGTFSDVTEKAKVSGRLVEGRKPWSVAAAWVDYDNDGRLDLFVTNYIKWTPENSKTCGFPGKRISCSPTLYEGESNMLFHNNGDGTFTDVSASTGISGQIGKGMGVAIADYDGDGWMDIFVGNDKDRNFLFHNLQGKGFEEVGVETFTAFTDNGIPVSSMGVDFRDTDNSGRPSVFVTALGGETFPYFHNDDGKTFSVDTFPAGIGFPSMIMSGWGDGIVDLDNDGNKDIFTANSHVSENMGDDPQHRYPQPDAIFRNMGNGRFKDLSALAGPALQASAVHRGCAFGDLNNDGRIDVVVSAIGAHLELLYNTTETKNHWILLQLTGVRSNRDGIGTQVRITGESGLVQYNHATTAGSFASSSDKRVHFGLGADARIKEIELRWPSGIVQVFHNVKVDQVLKITEPEKAGSEK